MTACLHHIGDDPNGLRCTLAEHLDHPNGHLYRGSSVADLHDASEQRAEDTR